MAEPAIFSALGFWQATTVIPELRFIVALAACVVACTALCVVARVHTRRLLRIPIRIHVAGTRGKSATVRLLAAGLRAGGHRVVAKVTGTRPCLILPDGTEQPIRRWGEAAIGEQRRLIACAHRARATVVVAEAMAIRPEYLDALERFYIRATDLVITNVRPDHWEQLGSAPEAMADAVAACVPSRGRLFLTAEAAVPSILQRAAARQSQVVTVTAAKDDDPEADNWRLATEVCGYHGISAESAQAAMHAASRDLGSFAIATISLNGRRLEFANAFACNDPRSFELLWARHQPASRGASFLFNPRLDRPVRTVEFLKLLARLRPDALLFIGSRHPALRSRAIASGFEPERIRMLSPRMTARTLARLAAEIPQGAILWGAGNYRGAGSEFSALIERTRVPC